MTRLLASLLICVSLLTQAFTPALAGAAMGGAATGASAAALNHCKLLHHTSPAAGADAKRGPAPDGPRHDHQSCSQCQMGSNTSPLDPRLEPVVFQSAPESRAEFAVRGDIAIFLPPKRGPRARAPPSQA